jgi:hypothetical protein
MPLFVVKIESFDVWTLKLLPCSRIPGIHLCNNCSHSLNSLYRFQSIQTILFCKEGTIVLLHLDFPSAFECQSDYQSPCFSIFHPFLLIMASTINNLLLLDVSINKY